jgi:hypothetical protein
MVTTDRIMGSPPATNNNLVSTSKNGRTVTITFAITFSMGFAHATVGNEWANAGQRMGKKMGRKWQDSDHNLCKYVQYGIRACHSWHLQCSPVL